MITRHGCAALAGLAVVQFTAAPALGQSSVTYAYDALGRVTQVTYANGAYALYEYDPAGNRKLLVMSLTPNHPPVAAPDTVNVLTGGTVVASVLQNDSDSDLDTLKITSLTQPTLAGANATVINNNTQVQYVAGATAGVDTLTYAIRDGRGGKASATLTVNVTAATAPTVANKSLTVTSGSSATVDATPTGNWTQLQFQAAPDGSKGTASISGANITYQANSGAASQLTDTFTYKAIGPGGTSNIGTVTATINPPAPQPPGVTDKSATVTSGSSVQINATPTGNWTSVQLVTQPNSSKGTASVSGATITYTALTGIGATTTDSFNYRAIGPGGASNTGTITVTINPAAQPPYAYDKYSPVGAGQQVVFDLTPSGAWSYLQIVTNPSLGSVNLSSQYATYTASNVTSQQYDSFTYRAVGPGGTSNTATVQVQLNPVVNPPSVSNKTATVTSGQQVTIPLSPSGNYSFVQIVTPPSGAKGTASISGLDAVYTANSGITSQTTDTFTFNATGVGGTSNTATVTVTINPAQSQLNAQLTALTFYRLRSGTVWQPATSVGATVTGGSGSYSYQWIRASGDANTVVSSGSSPSTAWTRNGVVTDNTWVSYWYCHVTDLVTGLTADTGQVQVTIEFSSNQ